VNESTKQETLRTGCQFARSAIDPSSHLWFALAVSLALHGLFLTALAVKSHWTPIYHPARYGMGSGFSVVQFVSGALDDSGKGPGSQNGDTGARAVELSKSHPLPVEIPENSPRIEVEPVEQVALQVDAGQEVWPVKDSDIAALRPESIAAGAATSEPPGVGSAKDGASSGGIDSRGKSDSGIGLAGSSGNGSSFGIPAYLRNPLPPYPRVARERGWEGTTVLQVEILDDGSGGRVEILESSGHEVLDEAAAKTVRHWKFLPARSGDTPVRSLVEIPIRFRMAGN
jgi:protein TonB